MSKSNKASERPFSEKLKQWFKRNKSLPPSSGQAPEPTTAAAASASTVSSSEEINLSFDIMNGLGPESPTQERLKIIRELKDQIRNRRLQDHGVELLFRRTKDLLDNESLVIRHDVIYFYEALVLGQLDHLDLMMRAHFFKVVKEKKRGKEDFVALLALFAALTENGKDILYFEEEVGPFLLQISPHVVSGSSLTASHTYDFLQTVVNVFQYNSAYLDSEIVDSIIGLVSYLCMVTNDEKETHACLEVLDAVICYSYIPKNGLLKFISTLCRVVNLEAFGKEAWRITRRLMGTHLGHSALYCLSMIIQTYENHSDVALIRGAIFFIGISLWGISRIKTLDYSAVTILPTFVHALSCKHHLIIYEVTQQIQRLVTNYGEELRAAACDSVIEIIERLLHDIPRLSSDIQSTILKHIHDTMTIIETLSEKRQYNGSQQKLFNVIDLCADQRPENSVIRLITYRSNSIHAAKPDWIRILYNLMERYYKKETRVRVRIKTLSVLLNIVKSNHYTYEEELIDRVVIRFLSNVESERDPEVRSEAIKVLTALCSVCSTKKNLELLSTLEKVIKNSSREDIRLTVEGLIQVFKDKLYQLPSPFILRVLSVLTHHLESHYNESQKGDSEVRYLIFRLFLSLRAQDETYHLGIASENDNSVHYSPYIICKNPEEEKEAESIWTSQHSSSPPSSPLPKQNAIFVSLNKACLLVIQCLERERDWNVLSLVLNRVPTVLQNKGLIYRYGKSINKFVPPLIALTDKNPGLLSNTPSKFSRSDFNNHVFPVLAALASYNEFLEPSAQTAIIRALELGLLSRECNRMCIVALTASALEMKKTMYHLIPEVILNFSKISATKSISTPILEFLSTMVRLPEVFSSFTDTNYITVFAIALPFTNPFKFDLYTVSLAHHVIVMWFLKCRLAYRQNFVQFIINGLNNNIIVPFREENQDSSARKRSTSLTEKSLEAAATSNRQSQLAFHQELTETCLDILARYMYGNVSVKTRRFQTADFILKNGHSATWLIGTMLITVSTSCCTHIANRGGLCDYCYFYCIKDGKEGSPGNNSAPIQGQGYGQPAALTSRRRHVSEFHTSPSRRLNSLGSKVKEDMDLRRQLSAERLESITDESKAKQKLIQETCSCWCSGWAEIYIRRPSGDVSWMCRVQNTQLLSAHSTATNMYELSALFQSAFVEKPPPTTVHPLLNPESRIDVENLSEKEYLSLLLNTQQQQPAETEALTSEPIQDPQQQQQQQLKSPVKKTKSSPEVGSAGALTTAAANDAETQEMLNRKSCDPIPEVDEDVKVDMRRRQSAFDIGRKSLPPEVATATQQQTVSEEQQQPHPPPPQKCQLNRHSTPSDVMSHLLNQPGLRTTRSHTISGTSPRNRVSSSNNSGVTTASSSSSNSRRQSMDPGGYIRRPTGEKSERVSGISPQFVFLQLYQSCTFGNTQTIEKPLLLPSTKIIENSIKNLDRIPAHETHKIGVLYVGPNQLHDEVAILRNINGSVRYAEFLNGLGHLIDIRGVDKSTHFIGGLDSKDGDGNFAYMWEDDVMQVIFHVATLMPNHDRDPQANKKKRHIGNDYVAVVYNDSGNKKETYKMGTVKGKFISACIVITPLDQGSNRVSVDCRPELREPLGHVMDPKIVSDRSLSILVRQWALHCNLAAQIQQSLQQHNHKQHSSSSPKPYSSNWLERLRAIKRLKEKLLQEARQKEEKDDERERLLPGKPHLNDFTEYVLRKRRDDD